ncbi:MAG: hypothetical protein K9K21_03250 [Desulfotignum sp.]|nr:hypothetical protein [Desulfotignum sp.]MCF8125177.1 hypothetical protein [Desulfotignum sp.]
MADIVKPPSSENRALIRKIALNTGQTLVISDLSRKISADACVVIMQAAMEIRVEPDLFENEPLSGITFEQIRDTLGETVIYEYRLERNFIMDHEKETVLASLVDTFMKNTGRYISKPGFAPKLVLKEYRNRTQSAGPSKKGEQD